MISLFHNLHLQRDVSVLMLCFLVLVILFVFMVNFAIFFPVVGTILSQCRGIYPFLKKCFVLVSSFAE